MRLRSSATLLLALAGWATAQTYSLKTFAGGALPEGVPPAAASLGAVYGIAMDHAGQLYLALGDYDIVVRINATTGLMERVAGTGTAGFKGDGGPATEAQLSGPTGLAIDSAGVLYIADSRNFRVRKVAGGIITTFAGNGTQGFSGDGGPAADARLGSMADLDLDLAGNLYMADYSNHAIRMVAGGVIATVAGTGNFGYGGDNGPATSADLAGPSGIALDAAGNLYIADVYNNRIRKVSNGIITTVAGTGTAGFTGDKGAATSATLRQPADVAVTSTGILLIADFGNNRIRSVANGVITTVAGLGTAASTGDAGAGTSAALKAPRRIFTDVSGNLFIADDTRLRRLSAGIINTVAGGGSPAGETGPAIAAQLHSPQGLAADGAGNIYITDAGTGRVLKVSGGSISKLAGTGSSGLGGDNGTASAATLSSVSGVAVDSAGNVYVADTGNARVRRIASDTISTVAGGGSTLGDKGPATSAQLSNPQSVAVDTAGYLYIADGNRVRTVAGGTIDTTVGNGGLGCQGDGGVATAAYLSSPTGLAADAAGTLYIADSGNNRLRMVSGGMITTVAGTGTYGATGSNGTATSATLGTPAGVAVDLAGDLYLTDAYRVLKVSKGKISTLAGLAAPQGIAVDGAGNVYVAAPAAHRVWVLTPAAGNCAVAAAPNALQAPPAGGSLALTIQTGSNCPWAVEALPAWAAVAGDLFGTGPATINVSLNANPHAPRSAVILVGGQNVTITQAGTAMAISGQVTRGTAIVEGVKLTLSGGVDASATSDSGGNFTFAGLASNASYTVTPSLSGYAFVPASQTFSNVASNPTANFSAWLLPQVSGVGPVFASVVQPIPTTYAPGEIVSVFGVNFCASPASAAPTLPDRLAACIVQVDGANMRLYYASEGQINMVLPQTLATGSHRLVVMRYTDTGYRTLAAQSPAFNFTVAPIAPAFVERAESGNWSLLVQYTDGGLAGASRPLHAGDYVTLYLTGLGRKAQTYADGAAPKVASPAVEPVQVQVAGLSAQVLYAGIQPQSPGLDQITLQLPKYTLQSAATTVTIQITAPTTGKTVKYDVAAR